jgi:hypothetical protein
MNDDHFGKINFKWMKEELKSLFSIPLVAGKGTEKASMATYRYEPELKRIIK